MGSELASSLSAGSAVRTEEMEQGQHRRVETGDELALRPEQKKVFLENIKWSGNSLWLGVVSFPVTSQEKQVLRIPVHYF